MLYEVITARLFRELKKLVNSLQDVEDSREFLESLRGELDEPEVYALTPNGEVGANLEPDRRIAPEFAAWSRGEDPALEWILAQRDERGIMPDPYAEIQQRMAGDPDAEAADRPTLNTLLIVVMYDEAVMRNNFV